MCFSASVSYGAAAILLVTGAATTRGNPLKSHRMIAAIPILFGVQQAAEGIIWQTMGQGASSSFHQFAVFLYLTFVYVVWPSWLPWSLYNIEIIGTRKRILKILGVVGLGVSLLAVSMIYGLEIRAYVAGHSLAYSFPNLKKFWPAGIEFPLYLIPTMLPFFASSLRMVKRAGYLVFASLLLAQVVNQETTTSVWCFFAALISFYIAVNVLWVRSREVA